MLMALINSVAEAHWKVPVFMQNTFGLCGIKEQVFLLR